MAYQRALWHSGLTYQRICPECNMVFQYTDYSLGFRPWFADGYIDCPRCRRHMRHDEKFAVNALNNVQVSAPPSEAAATNNVGKGAFCTQCGSKFGDSDFFCAKCGSKRS